MKREEVRVMTIRQINQEEGMREKEVKIMTTEQVNQVITAKEERAIRIGATVKIKKCAPMPEVVGEKAEIVDMQIQEFDKYAVYPVWAKMLTGERKSKIYGFQYDELEVLAKAEKEGTMKTKAVEQLEEILKGITTGEERAIRIGATVRIKKCAPVPKAVGEEGEIVDMQIQEFEKYAVYPVWVKMLTGEYKGKVYGFQYDELEVIAKADKEEMTKKKMVEQIEECLKAIRIGSMVRIRKCDSVPNVVGEEGEIVDTQIQEFEKYTVYPVWVKMLTGERKGKVYGFKYDEMELLPKAVPRKIAKTKMGKQLEELLKGITTVEDIAEIEKAIAEVKGKILTEETEGFWKGKTPCWEMLRCPEAIRNECPAYKHQGLPCWQIEGTYSKLHGGGQKGCNTDICRVCRVYKRWGQDEPIEIKLFDKGFNAVEVKAR